MFLISADSPRAGEEERRIWTPVVLGLATLVLLIRLPILLRIDRRALFNPASLCFAGYLIWLAAGLSWSINFNESLNHVLMLSIVFFAVLSTAENKVYQTALIVTVITALVIMTSWLTLAAGFDWALSRTDFWRLKGIMTHEQTLALVCISAMLLAIIWSLNRRRCGLEDYRSLVIGFVVLAFITVLAAKARSFTVFSLATAMLIAFAHASGNRRVGVAFAGLVGLAALVLSVEFILPLFERSHQDATLSGRTIIWAMTWEEIQARPLHGFGFATYPGYFEKLWNNWFPAHAHNLWLQVWFENGLIGVLLITGFLSATILQGLRFQRQTGLLSYTLFFSIFLTLASIMAVVIGAKLTTPYGLLLIVALQEEVLRGQALDHARQAGPQPPFVPGKRNRRHVQGGSSGWASSQAGPTSAAGSPIKDGSTIEDGSTSADDGGSMGRAGGRGDRRDIAAEAGLAPNPAVTKAKRFKPRTHQRTAAATR